MPHHPAFLGDLEMAVMERLWAHGEADVKALHKALVGRRGITLNTVQSTVKRLLDKGLLQRRKVSHAYIYRPSISRREHQRQALQRVVDEVMDGEPALMLAAFVDLAERAGDEQLDRLEQLIEARRREGS